MIQPIVELIRLEDHNTFGTFGVLKICKQLFCITLEPPENANKSNISCIPAGQYDCLRYRSIKYPDTFEITNVPDRSKVLFHAGNFVENTMGCVLLGQSVGKLKGNRAVLNSGGTFKNFMLHMNGNAFFHLTIREVY